MRRSFTAKIKPEILIWARKSAGYKSVESAAIALNLPVEKLVGWEESGSITLAKLRDLARVYKRPLAVFYLQDVPKDFMALSDLRRHRDNLNKELSPGLVQEIRIAQQRRELALDLSSDTDTPINKFDFKLAINVDTELAAASIRKFLDINDDELSKNTSGSDGYKAFNFWRKKVESKGVLVFQMAKVDSSEASGFAVTKVFFPIIGINKKDPPTRRLFSLIHELTHIVIGSSSVSDLEMNAAASNANVNLERFCDRVAAATLVPKGLLLSDSHVLNAKKNEGKLPDEEISFLAKKFGVSREALLLRLVTFKISTWDYFFTKKQQWDDEYRQLKIAEAKSNKGKSIPRDMPKEALSNLGGLYLGLIFDNYHQSRITLSEVSGYLGIKTKHISTLESKLRAAA